MDPQHDRKVEHSSPIFIHYNKQIQQYSMQGEEMLPNARAIQLLMLPTLLWFLRRAIHNANLNHPVFWVSS